MATDERDAAGRGPGSAGVSFIHTRNGRTTGWARVAAVTAAALLATSLGQAPALAHQFQVVVVESESQASTDARRGFRVAVDQSPDVSHPPGQDGGDHLGGVDVELLSLDLTGTGRQTADRIRRLVDDGAAAVLLLTGGPAVEAVIEAASAQSTLVISGTLSPPASSTDPRIELRLKPPEQRDRVRTEAFVVAFIDAYEVAPTDAALLGYDVGLLLDGLVRQVGEELRSPARVMAAARLASSDLVASGLDVHDNGASESERGPDVPTESSPRRPVVAAMLASAALAAIVGAVLVALRHRGPRRSRARPPPDRRPGGCRR